MHTITINNVRAKINEAIPFKVSQEIDAVTSYSVPGANFATSFRKGWDGKIRCYNKKAQTFPTGLLNIIGKILTANNLPYTVQDQRTVPISGEKLPTYDITYRNYQNDAINAALAAKRGLLSLFCGGGKSAIIANICGQLNVKTLIIVHTLDLLDQMKDNIEKYLRIECGIIGGGVIDPQRITVATIQTVCKAFDEKYEKADEVETLQDFMALDKESKEVIQYVVQQCEMMIVDEVQHLSANTFQKVAKKCTNAYYRFGVSATIWRDDNAEILIHSQTGDIFYDHGASALIKEGFLVKPYIYVYDIPPSTITSDLYGDFHEMYENNIVNNAYRNNLVVESVEKLYNNKKRILVLVKHIAHGNILLKAIKKKLKHVKVYFVQGCVQPEDRRAILDGMRNHEIEIIIGTALADEGLDIPSLDSVILAGAGKSKSRALQRIGRTMRPHGDKEKAIVIDFYDRGLKYLAKHSRARIKIYQSEPEFVVKIQEETT